MDIKYKKAVIPSLKQIGELYSSVDWGHRKCPKATHNAIRNSSCVITAWHDTQLVALGRALTDGTLTVYFPDLLVKPQWQGKGIGSSIMKMLLKQYGTFHNQVLIAEDEKAQKFYAKKGFKNEIFAMSIMKPFPNEL